MRSVQAGRIVHALLFVGPRGSGKRTMARLFAQAMLCKGREPRPCGVCPACKRFLAGSHPDVKTLRPEKKTIGVDDIRDLIDYLSLKPYEGGRHIAIIEQADSMTPPAQNALLKTLENPDGAAMFFLIAEGDRGLLPTIRSRCQAVRFRDLPVEDCAAVLARRGVAPERARMLAGMAQGSVGRALELDADERAMALREKVLESLETLRDAASVSRAAALLEDDKGAEGDILDIMELWARDRMAAQAGAQPYQAGEYDRLVKGKIDGRALLKGVVEARKRLASNVAWPGVLENMYFDLINKENSGRTTLSWQR
ncbi:MAG: DNA polymerase III subunit delta' [Clostridia bacterium]|nr:DNA polymerase III subunit delta' [Clostridia bacterium]